MKKDKSHADKDSEEEPRIPLSTEPIELPSQDCLGMDDKAKAIAGNIPLDRSYSLLIDGDYGTGKSSFSNLLVLQIKDRIDVTDLTISI